MLVEKNGQNFIKEGKALIQTKRVYQEQGKLIEESVFYNPAQVASFPHSTLDLQSRSHGSRD